MCLSSTEVKHLAHNPILRVCIPKLAPGERKWRKNDLCKLDPNSQPIYKANRKGEGEKERDKKEKKRKTEKREEKKKEMYRQTHRLKDIEIDIKRI